MRRINHEEYKSIVLSILFRIDAICREHGINYLLFYGSLLGAVRHGGFIPWDDDIDLIMLRDDYDHLREVILAHPESGIRFIDIISHDHTIYPFAKVCDIRTKLNEVYFEDVEGYGAFVDIFPLDHLPEDDRTRTRVMKRCERLNRLRVVGSRAKPVSSMTGMKRIKGYAAYCFSQLVNSQAVVKKIDDIGRRLNEAPSSLVGLAEYLEEVYPLDWLFPAKEILFEGIPVMAPAKIDLCLRQEYGDYMQLPPENERVPHAIDCWIEEDSVPMLDR